MRTLRQVDLTSGLTRAIYSDEIVRVENDAGTFIGNYSWSESTRSWVPEDLGGTGTGDWTGPASGNTVVGIRGVSVDSTVPTTAGQVLEYDGASKYVAGQPIVSVLDVQALVPAYNRQLVRTYDPAQPSRSYYFYHNGSSWVPTRDRSILFFNEYGAEPGTNTSGARTANFDAFTDLLAAATNNETEAWFDGLDYYFDQTLLIDNLAATPKSGLTIRGVNPFSNAVSKTRLLYTANTPTVPFILIASRCCILDGFCVTLNGANANALVGIEVGTATNGSYGVTNNTIRRCLVDGRVSQPTSGFVYGMGVGITYTALGNNEDTHFVDASSAHCLTAQFAILTNGQPYNTTFVDCSAGNYRETFPTTYGLLINNSSCSAKWSGGNITRMKNAFRIETNANVDVQNLQSEQCKRLLYVSFTTASTVTFSGGGSRINMSYAGLATDDITDAADKRFIIASGESGLLKLSGFGFGSSTGNAQDPDVRFDVGCSLVADNMFLPNDHVFDHAEVLSSSPTVERTAPITLIGCRTFSPDSVTVVPYPDQPTACRNGGGSVVFRGTATTATVTIRKEFDTNYDIITDVSEVSGAAAAATVTVSSKTQTTFVLTLSAAPGAGTSRTVKWRMSRASQPSTDLQSGKVYGFSAAGGKYYATLSGAGEAGDAAGFGFGVLFQAPSSSVSSTGRTLFSAYSGAGGYDLTCAGSFATAKATFRDGASGAVVTPTYTFVAGDFGKMMMLIAYHDGANARLYSKRLEVGAGTAIVGYTSASVPNLLGSYASNTQPFVDGYIYGGFTFRGTPALADIQAYYDDVKTACDIVTTGTLGGLLTHAWSVRTNRRRNAPWKLEDLVGTAEMVRLLDPGVVTAATPTWSW